MNNWKCMKCKCTNRYDISRCSFCVEPRPADDQLQAKKDAQSTETKLETTIHNEVSKMSHNARVRLYRWMEDNII